MNVLKVFGSLFVKIGEAILGAIKEANFRGLTDEIVEVAKEWVKVAAQQQLDNTQKREFVLAVLVKRFPMIPESILRLALELAYQAVKKELEKL